MDKNFVAIDFETATNTRMACQLGVVVVKNGDIIEKKEFLIQPPGNKYDANVMNYHHVTPEDTHNAPTFDVLWNDIQHYFTSYPLYAHNSRFDKDVLNKNLDHYNMMPMGIKEFNCTCDSFRRKSLKSLCVGFGLDYDANAHHNALYDAECCAKFALQLIDGNQPDWKKMASVDRKEKSTAKSYTLNFADEDKTLKGDILIKDLASADKDSPFYDRKVVITGDFNQKRSELAMVFKKLGADIDNSVTKRTNFVFIGDRPGPSKLDKLEALAHNGFKIRRLYQNDVDAIFQGEFEGYHINKENVKELNFTYSHYEKSKVCFPDCNNIIASKELFFGKGFAGNISLFRQITGNLGACGDHEIYSETNMIVLSDSTLTKLENAEKDETILYIENHYNTNKSHTFQFSFISESIILDYCKERCIKFGDDLTMSLYEQYMDSAMIKLENYNVKYEFKEDLHYCKVSGKYVFRLDDERTWCPSRQHR